MPHRGENKRFSTLRCTKTGDTQPKLSAACFVVQSCLADADFVVFSNYCLIGTRLKPVRYFLISAEQIPGVDLFLHIIQAGIVAVGNDCLALSLKISQIVDHL